ncbi:hypothetical protein GCM10011402_03150 [Paracoccus acridae]|uniref:Uncharacterized protein n=1 Tax=Paracoccus acridae TaxID=1795310 RepID=A0ABQ1VCH3_9RHOB|nr:hypothetical protein GCM10011402_03150 [Paracoccus acridae]
MHPPQIGDSVRSEKRRDGPALTFPRGGLFRIALRPIMKGMKKIGGWIVIGLVLGSMVLADIVMAQPPGLV